MNWRDSDSSTWVASSSRVRSALDALSKRRDAHQKGDYVSEGPKLHSSEEIAAAAIAADEERRLTKICQQASSRRTDDDIRFVCQQLQLFSFWQLWPAAVQRELAKVLSTEGKVKHETVISRGSLQTRVIFVISGQLRVSVPANVSSDIPEDQRGRLVSEGGASCPSPPAVSEMQFGAAPPPRKLATLGKGDTCGEACLLGGPAGGSIAHADIIVSSPGAVMLSLGQGDFVKALKEILGLRHQDRLMYLRSHPLFVDVSLEDLDQASDLLSLSFFTPGSVLYPDPSGEDRMYLIAEGECSVRRRKGKGHREQERNRPTAYYDEDTCSVLGSLEIFGLDPSGGYSTLPPPKDGPYSNRPSTAHGTSSSQPQPQPAYVVEASSQVKAYYVSRELFSQLPISFQQIVEQACSFKNSFLSGRLQSRTQPNNPSTTIPSTSQQTHLARSESLRQSTSSNPLAPSPLPQTTHQVKGSKISPILTRLATNQVADLFKADASKSLTAAGFNSQDTITESTDKKNTARFGRRKEEVTSNHSTNIVPHTKIISAPLSLLPPSETTWSRLPIARKRTVETEQPSQSKIPSALASRHAAVFASSQRALHANKPNAGRGIQGIKKNSLTGPKGTSAFNYFDDEDEFDEAWRRSSGAGLREHHSIDRDLRVLLAQQQAQSSFSSSVDGHLSMNQTMKKGSSEILRIDDSEPQARVHSNINPSKPSGAQPSSSREGTRRERGDRKSRGRSTPPPSPPPAPPPSKNSLLNDTMAPSGQRPHKPRKQGALLEDVPADHPQEQGYCLPASVVLGYENLNPFQWAQLQSYFQKSAGDSVLPKPKW